MESNVDSANRIEYQRPIFHRRVFADLLDAFIMLMLAVLCFLGFRAVFAQSSEYQMRSARMDQNRSDSGLYIKNEGSYSLLSDYYPNNSSLLSSKEVMTKYEEGLETFLAYLGQNVSQDAQSIVQKDYDSYRLALQNEGVSYFVSVSGKIEKNPASTATYEAYSSNVYRPYYADHAEGYFTVYAPHFIDDTHYFSQILLFVEIPCSIAIGSLLAFFVPPLFFKRSRATLGKYLYKIGRVDSHCLSVKIGRYCAESAILIFGVVVLSLFTLGIPLIISFSLMVFSKHKQDFPDYMLGIQEIDITTDKIYHSIEEAKIDQAESAGKHIDFQTTTED